MRPQDITPHQAQVITGNPYHAWINVYLTVRAGWTMTLFRRLTIKLSMDPTWSHNQSEEIMKGISATAPTIRASAQLLTIRVTRAEYEKARKPTTQYSLLGVVGLLPVDLLCL